MWVLDRPLASKISVICAAAKPSQQHSCELFFMQKNTLTCCSVCSITDALRDWVCVFAWTGLKMSLMKGTKFMVKLLNGRETDAKIPGTWPQWRLRAVRAFLKSLRLCNNCMGSCCTWIHLGNHCINSCILALKLFVNLIFVSPTWIYLFIYVFEFAYLNSSTCIDDHWKQHDCLTGTHQGTSGHQLTVLLERSTHWGQHPVPFTRAGQHDLQVTQVNNTLLSTK